MEYNDIFILGWDINAIMFLVNFLLASFFASNINDPQEIYKQTSILKELKEEYDKLYPNRRYDTIISYIVPFAAFFRTAFRLFEMFMFFKANKGTELYDYMIYKYSKDIKQRQKVDEPKKRQ